MGDFMENYTRDVQLFMIFDILGDTVRTGPQLWKIKRKRLEDVKNHILDLLLIIRILKRRLPNNLDYDKIVDYIICHDLPEAITGDITKFEGVSEEERSRVTQIATKYLAEKFGDIIDIGTILNNYENRIDIESKIVNMVDKVHSAFAFIKYQSEEDIDMNDPGIIPCLRYLPFVDDRIKSGLDLADIFYQFHIRSVNISDEELVKFNISREEADNIVAVIKGWAEELYSQKIKKTLLDCSKDFPQTAMIYNKRYRI